MSGLTSDARAVPHGGGGRQGGTKTRAAGIPVKTLSVLPSSCPNIFFYFSWEISKESPKPVREDRQRWWEHKAVMCLGVERGPGY